MKCHCLLMHENGLQYSKPIAMQVCVKFSLKQSGQPHFQGLDVLLWRLNKWFTYGRSRVHLHSHGLGIGQSNCSCLQFLSHWLLLRSYKDRDSVLTLLTTSIERVYYNCTNVLPHLRKQHLSRLTQQEKGIIEKMLGRLSPKYIDDLRSLLKPF